MNLCFWSEFIAVKLKICFYTGGNKFERFY